MRHTINVGQRHIDAGEPKRCSLCPVALALIDAGFGFAYVGTMYMEAQHGGEWRMAPVPDEVQAFIRDFDNGLPVSPLTFDAEFRDDATL
jgi:hypothetical protein